MSTPHTLPATLGAPLRRPEVPHLLAALEKPLNVDDRDPAKGQIVVLDFALAQDLADLVADLCTAAGDHRRCTGCKEVVFCDPCGLGDIDNWCYHHDLCLACVGRCMHCAGERV